MFQGLLLVNNFYEYITAVNLSEIDIRKIK